MITSITPSLLGFLMSEQFVSPKVNTFFDAMALFSFTYHYPQSVYGNALSNLKVPSSHPALTSSLLRHAW